MTLTALLFLWNVAQFALLRFLPGYSGVPYLREFFLILVTVLMFIGAVVSPGRAMFAPISIERAVILMAIITSGLVVGLGVLVVGGMGLLDRIKGVYGVTVPLLIITIVAAADTMAWNRRFVWCIFMMICVVVVCGLCFEFATGGAIFLAEKSYTQHFAGKVYRPSFLFDSPMAAGYVTAFMAFYFLGVGVGAETGRFRRMFSFMLSGAAAVACLLSLSRGPALVLGAGLFIFLMSSLRAGIGILLPTCVVFAVGVSVALGNESVRGWLSLTTDFDSQSGNVVRLTAWLSGLEIMRNSGPLGIGIGAMRNLDSRYELGIGNTESTPLTAFAEGGWLLGIAISVLLVLVASVATRRLLLRQAPLISAVSAFVLASVGYALVFPIFVDRMTGVLFAMATGFVLSSQTGGRLQVLPDCRGALKCKERQFPLARKRFTADAGRRTDVEI